MPDVGSADSNGVTGIERIFGTAGINGHELVWDASSALQVPRAAARGLDGDAIRQLAGGLARR